MMITDPRPIAGSMLPPRTISTSNDVSRGKATSTRKPSRTIHRTPWTMAAIARWMVDMSRVSGGTKPPRLT